MVWRLKNRVVILRPRDLLCRSPGPASLGPKSFLCVALVLHECLILRHRDRVTADFEPLLDQTALKLPAALPGFWSAHLEISRRDFNPVKVGQAVDKADAFARVAQF